MAVGVVEQWSFSKVCQIWNEVEVQSDMWHWYVMAAAVPSANAVCLILNYSVSLLTHEQKRVQIERAYTTLYFRITADWYADCMIVTTLRESICHVIQACWRRKGPLLFIRRSSWASGFSTLLQVLGYCIFTCSMTKENEDVTLPTADLLTSTDDVDQLKGYIASIQGRIGELEKSKSLDKHTGLSHRSWSYL